MRYHVFEEADVIRRWAVLAQSLEEQPRALARFWLRRATCNLRKLRTRPPRLLVLPCGWLRAEVNFVFCDSLLLLVAHRGRAAWSRETAEQGHCRARTSGNPRVNVEASFFVCYCRNIVFREKIGLQRIDMLRRRNVTRSDRHRSIACVFLIFKRPFGCSFVCV